jgi:dolichol-phosphate mannosyltransferase
MYEGWHETWRNWPRSLPMRDQYFGFREAAGLLEVLLVQSAPLPLLALAHALGAPSWFVVLNLILGLSRIGMLIGTARAYERKPWTYWFSPILDLPVALRLLTSALKRHQVWRGRVYIRRAGGSFEPLDSSKTATM